MSLSSLSIIISTLVVFGCKPATACTDDTQCGLAEACLNGVCADPCKFSDCGDPNAVCVVADHIPKCECKSGFVFGRGGCKPNPGGSIPKPSFVYVDVELPWEQARTNCSERGMKLATIENEWKKSELQQFIQKIGNIEYKTPQSSSYVYYPLPSRRLKFELQATIGEGHLAFSKTNVFLDKNIVEVSVGSDQNKRVTLIKNHNSKADAEIEIPNLVSSSEFRGFWVDVGRVYRVGKKNEETALMTWEDPEPSYVNYFGIQTGLGSFGVWSFYGETCTTNSTGAEKSSYDPYYYTRLPQFSLDITVRANESVQIALASGPQNTSLVYEIILGGWGNTASAIRYQQADKVRVDTPGLLSAGEDRRFRITWKNGLVKVFLRLEQNMAWMMKWQNEEYVEITHYGLMSPSGEASWSVIVTDDVNGLATTGRLWLGGEHRDADDQFRWLGSGEAITSDWFTGKINTGFPRDNNYIGRCLSTAPLEFGPDRILDAIEWFKADCFTEFKFICESTTN